MWRKTFPSLRRHDPDQVRRVRPQGHLSSRTSTPRNGASIAGRGPRGKRIFASRAELAGPRAIRTGARKRRPLPMPATGASGQPACQAVRGLGERRRTAGALFEGQDGALAGLVDEAGCRSSPRSLRRPRLVVTSLRPPTARSRRSPSATLAAAPDQRLAAAPPRSASGRSSARCWMPLPGKSAGV